MDSPFLNSDRIYLENEHAIAIYDGYPVSKGHSLVVPKKIIHSIFQLKNEEYLGCFELVREVREFLKNQYNPDGFNIGINNGEDAGQTVSHAHIHIIPRYKGDVQNPRGGVRNVIPDKGNY
jgi:diadenosine tetraphosphate (Ap4A) HIT family hydrolase